MSTDGLLLTNETAYPEPINFDWALRVAVRSSKLGVQTTLSGGRPVRWSAQEPTSIEPANFANNVLRVSNSLSGALGRSNETLSVTLTAPVTTVTCIKPELGTVLEPDDDVYYVSKIGDSFRVQSRVRRISISTPYGLTSMNQIHLHQCGYFWVVD
jgi:hypothetical protein